MKRKKLVLILVSSVIILVGLFVSAFPLIWMFLSAFKDPSEIIAVPVPIFPKALRWQNFVDALNIQPILLFFANSYLVTCSVTVGTLFTSSLAGYAFAKLKFRGRDAFFLLILSTMMIPSFLTMVPLFIIMSPRLFNWIDTFQALIIPFLASPFGVFLMRQFVSAIPDELIDGARVDGASHFDIYLRIILPLSKPVLATLGVFTFFTHWNSFIWPLLILHTTENFTLPLGIDLLSRTAVTGLQLRPDLLMAGSVIAVIPVLIAFFIAQRQIIQGISTTGIKG